MGGYEFGESVGTLAEIGSKENPKENHLVWRFKLTFPFLQNTAPTQQRQKKESQFVQKVMP